ncbi:MAG: hypothetical protein JWM33_486 [Caulobacteraceae bacterium]|nr:hypothetical protein [Caulobacteraceae bacterium]
MRLAFALTWLILFPASALAAVGPDELPGQVVGVVGSGDRLRLMINVDGANRELKIGDGVDEGWTLTALSPSSATLSRAGQTREIGLGPDGALASAESVATPSTVMVVGRTPQDMLAKALAEGSWNGLPIGNLSQEETELRVSALGQIAMALQDKARLNPDLPPDKLGIEPAEAAVLLGADRQAALMALTTRSGPLVGARGSLAFIGSDDNSVWYQVVTIIILSQ